MRRLFLVIRSLEAALLASAMLAIAAITIVNVFARNVFGANLAAAEELSEFLIVLVCFVGLSYAASRGRHIRMTALFDQLGPRARKRLMMLICATTSALLFALAWFALRYVTSVDRRSPVLGVPLRLVYLTAPVGLFLGGVQYLLGLARNLVSEEIYVAFEEVEGARPAKELTGV